MSRIRTIKPEFFRHAELFEAEKSSGFPLRVAFAALWTVADRDGRFRWKPRELKLDCLPYDDLDFSKVLDALCENGFVVMYSINGELYGYIPSFASHQVFNVREPKSKLPDPSSNETSTVPVSCEDSTGTVPNTYQTPTSTSRGRGRGNLKEGEGEGELEGEGNRKKESLASLATRARARETDHDFENFWERNRNKVGKGAAQRAFGKARMRATLAEILQGLEKYIRDKPPDRQWCNPATWLNQDRWKDQPALIGVTASNGHRRPITAFSRPSCGETIAAFERSAAAHRAEAARIRREIEQEAEIGTVSQDRH